MTHPLRLAIFKPMNQYHPAFDTLSENDLPEYRARGVLLRHRGTGCEVYKLHADEEENSFAFVFRTPPRDGTGVAHIVEHSVLCGSEAYPVKESFLVMSRRSLATFMNAFTWPDKTVYPAASAVKADFYNLLSVYGDAVFHPLMTRETFMQEAHHLEYDEAGRLVVKGVVYNEMRGDYSSADSLAGTASSTSLFSKGHPYSWDSGGDPEAIPALDFEGFRTFWEEHYHPSNCKIFLHGDMDLGEQLSFLDERFLKTFGFRRVDSAVPVQGRFEAPLRIARPYPMTGGSEASVQIVVNWLTAEITDEVEAFGLELLSEILLGHDGAPLAAALRTSELGEDLSPQCGIDTVFRQLIFSAGLRGTAVGREAEVEELILGTLRALVERGIPARAREAALHSFAFANREVRRDSSSYGLKLLFRALRGWLHGSGPESTLSFTRSLEGFERALAANPRWLESLAEKWLLANPHRSTVTIHPEEGLFERKQARAEEELALRERSLSEAEREAIRHTQAALAELQAKPDPPEKLALLPLLRVEDLPREIDTIPRESGLVLDLPLSARPLFTNGIVYLELAFPLDHLPREAQVWMPLLSRFISGAGLPGRSWSEVAEDLTLNAGAFSASLDSGRPLGAPESARTYILFRLKALADRFPRALDLALSLLARADTADLARVGDLLAELGNDIVSALVPAGNSFALARASSMWSESLAIEEAWRGTSQVRFVKGLRARDEIAAVSEALAALRSATISREGLRVSLSADGELLDGARAALERGLPLLAPARSPTFPASPALDPAARHEAYVIPAQVGYAAVACRASRFGERAFAHESILCHLLSRGAFWDELRVRRGAYGASAYLESLEGVACFSTYRDPRPADSIGWFAEALASAARGSGMEAAIESVIGACGRDLKPLLPEEKTSVDFRRELYGIEDRHRREKRIALLETREGDLRAAAERLAEALASASSVLISNDADVQSTRVLRGDTRIADSPL